MSAVGLCAAALLAALRFSIPEGGTLNEFYRDESVAAHLVLRSGPSPRIVFAFPAGNSGAALWLEAQDARFHWRPDVTMEPATHELAGRGLRGVSAVVTATGGPVIVRQAILGSIRVIRDAGDGSALPPGIAVDPNRVGPRLVWERARLDGKGGYALTVEVLEGRMDVDDVSHTIEFSPDSSGHIRLRVMAATGDPPLTPLAQAAVLTSAAAPDARLRRILAYLSYEEKLLAGSWRFATYFGRDTLMSLRLLSPVLQPEAFEAGLGSVLERLNRAGEVAHEEDIGEYALIRRRRAGEPLADTPILDYKMIDDDFMLPVVAAHYLLDSQDGWIRAQSFLARATGAGEPYGSALVRNLRHVVTGAIPFARDPRWQNLVVLKPGETAGNWRDSGDGLGGGRYPYDVNGVFVPAALEAVARLLARGLLAPYLDEESMARLGTAAAMARVWRREAPPLFEVEVAPEAGKASLETYARSVAVDPSAALAAIGATPLRFRAVALDGSGRPVTVLNSDEAFALLFLDLAPGEAARIAATLTRAFPAGLLTEVGLVVANPAFAPAAMQPAFDRNHYHGSVIWSWHHALLRAGLDRQLARDGLPPEARAALESSRRRLIAAMRKADDLRGSELWSWSQSGGEYRVEPFGQAQGHETESNAAQLWSAVHLAWR